MSNYLILPSVSQRRNIRYHIDRYSRGYPDSRVMAGSFGPAVRAIFHADNISVTLYNESGNRHAVPYNAISID